MGSFRIAALVVLSLVALPARADDLTIVSKIVSTGAPSTTTMTWYVSAQKMRIRDPYSDVIANVATGTITFVDHERQEYWVATQAEMNLALQRESEALAEQLKNPRTPQTMRELLGGPSPQVSVEKGTGSKTIAGYACQEYLVSVGPMRQQMWLTTTLEAPVSLAQWAAVQKGMFASAGPMAGAMAQVMDDLGKTKGFPLGQTTTTTIHGRTMVTTAEATEVKRGPLPPLTFSVPDEYARVDSPYSNPRSQ